MTILVIGSHGKVGKRIVKYLVEEGYGVNAMIRDKRQAEEMKSLGANPTIADLEEDFSHAYQGIDAVIFTAGSGSHTGPGKTISVDQEGAIKSIELAEKLGVKRYIMVSAQGAREPDVQSKIQHYYKAKALADERLVNSSIDYTIFRPGRLLDEEGDGLVQLSTSHLERSFTSRDILAKAIVMSVKMQNTYNKIIEIIEGYEPVEFMIKNI